MMAGRRADQRPVATNESFRIGAVSFFATVLILYLGAGGGLIG